MEVLAEDSGDSLFVVNGKRKQEIVLENEFDKLTE